MELKKRKMLDILNLNYCDLDVFIDNVGGIKQLLNDLENLNIDDIENYVNSYI